jgi:hypothetical protein
MLCACLTARQAFLNSVDFEEYFLRVFGCFEK